MSVKPTIIVDNDRYNVVLTEVTLVSKITGQNILKTYEVVVQVTDKKTKIAKQLTYEVSEFSSAETAIAALGLAFASKSENMFGRKAFEVTVSYNADGECQGMSSFTDREVSLNRSEIYLIKTLVGRAKLLDTISVDDRYNQLSKDLQRSAERFDQRARVLQEERKQLEEKGSSRDSVDEARYVQLSTNVALSKEVNLLFAKKSIPKAVRPGQSLERTVEEAAELLAEAKSLEGKFDGFTDALEAKEQELEALKAKNAALIAEKKTQIEALERPMMEAKAVLEGDLQDLQRQYDARQKEIEEETKTKEDLIGRLAVLESSGGSSPPAEASLLAAKRDEIQAKQGQNLALQVEINTKKREISDLATPEQAIATQKTRILLEIKHLEDEIKDKQAELVAFTETRIMPVILEYEAVQQSIYDSRIDERLSDFEGRAEVTKTGRVWHGVKGKATSAGSAIASPFRSAAQYVRKRREPSPVPTPHDGIGDADL